MTERDATWWYDGVDGRVSADRDAFRALLRERDALHEQIAGLTAALYLTLDCLVTWIDSFPEHVDQEDVTAREAAFHALAAVSAPTPEEKQG